MPAAISLDSTQGRSTAARRAVSEEGRLLLLFQDSEDALSRVGGWVEVRLDGFPASERQAFSTTTLDGPLVQYHEILRNAYTMGGRDQGEIPTTVGCSVELSHHRRKTKPQIKSEDWPDSSIRFRPGVLKCPYRGTSLIRKRTPL